MRNYFKEVEMKRVWFMLLGIALIGISIAMLRFSNFGTDPFSCMNLGVSSHLPISYGTYQMIVNILIFIPIIYLCPKSFGIGAICNMVFVGYFADFFFWIITLLGVTVEDISHNMVVRVGLLVGGVVILCLGVAIYMECDLGVAPYDMIAQVVEDRSHGKLSFKWVRVGYDLISVAIGYFSGGVVGIGTIVVAFFTGPIVSWFRKNVAGKILGSSVAE